MQDVAAEPPIMQDVAAEPPIMQDVHPWNRMSGGDCSCSGLVAAEDHGGARPNGGAARRPGPCPPPQVPMALRPDIAFYRANILQECGPIGWLWVLHSEHPAGLSGARRLGRVSDYAGGPGTPEVRRRPPRWRTRGHPWHKTARRPEPRGGSCALGAAGWKLRVGSRGLGAAGWEPRVGSRGLGAAGWEPRGGSCVVVSVHGVAPHDRRRPVAARSPGRPGSAAAGTEGGPGRVGLGRPGGARAARRSRTSQSWIATSPRRLREAPFRTAWCGSSPAGRRAPFGSGAGDLAERRPSRQRVRRARRSGRASCRRSAGR